MAVALIKFRILHDLKKLSLIYQVIGPKIPQGIFDMINNHASNDLTTSLLRAFKSYEEMKVPSRL